MAKTPADLTAKEVVAVRITIDQLVATKVNVFERSMITNDIRQALAEAVVAAVDGVRDTYEGEQS